MKRFTMDQIEEANDMQAGFCLAYGIDGDPGFILS